jgi:hypothetical protein
VHHTPHRVGETAAGDPIFEIRSVRLVLVGESTHFNRLAACSKCGADLVGPTVLTSADLDEPGSLLYCENCVRQVTALPRGPEMAFGDAGLARGIGPATPSSNGLRPASGIDPWRAHPAGDDGELLLGRLAEPSAGAATNGHRRADDLAQGAAVGTAVAGGPDAQAVPHEAGVREELAEVRASIAEVAAAVRALDHQMARNAGDVSALAELQADLDAEVGELRELATLIRDAQDALLEREPPVDGAVSPDEVG